VESLADWLNDVRCSSWFEHLAEHAAREPRHLEPKKLANRGRDVVVVNVADSHVFSDASPARE
jgi:hypothetical protein